jgi:8-amino-7-oxononanoate synthase
MSLSFNYQQSGPKRIREALAERQQNGRLRSLKQLHLDIDFSSNDYLGLSRSAWMQQSISNKLPHLSLGSTGSRLLNGNSPLAESLESKLANFFHSEAALLFNSGFDANLGLLSTVIRPGDLVFLDEAIHASMHKGLKLSGATLVSFRHNDIEDLKLKAVLHKTAGEIWLVAESYYSMDGDQAPLTLLAEIAEQHGWRLIIDEAHAVGCFGELGKGLGHPLRLDNRIFATVVTFGKALGTHGACILCTSHTKEYLINYCKAFIYTTALPAHSLTSIEAALAFLERFPKAQSRLQDNIRYFKEQTTGLQEILGTGPVFGWMIKGEQAVRSMAAIIQSGGIDVRPIVAPTVPKGLERLRISLHSFNTHQEIDLLLGYIKSKDPFITELWQKHL